MAKKGPIGKAVDDKLVVSFEEERKEFAAQLGEIIHVWAGVEARLMTIFKTCHGWQQARNDITTSLIFHETELFRTKLSMVNVAVLNYLGLFFLDNVEAKKDPFANAWITLRNLAQKLSNHRNRVAHGRITFNENEDLKYLLARPAGSAKWAKERFVVEASPIDFTTLKRWERELLELHRELGKFEAALKKKDKTLLPIPKKAAPKPRKRGMKKK